MSSNHPVLPARACLAVVWLAIGAGSVAAQDLSPQFGLPGALDAAAFDPQRLRPIAVARGTGMALDTWELHGGRWLRRDAPLPLFEPLLVTDTLRQRVLAFGGTFSATSPVFAYDGLEWQQVPSAAVPPSGGALVFDPLRDRVLSFGGRGSGFDLGNDELWAWQGGQWSRVPPAANWPPPRMNAMFAFDPLRGRAVLHGGESQLQLYNDTWEWDGSTWTQFLGQAPGPAVRAGFAYDPSTLGILRFGGWDGTQALDTTWRFDGLQWLQFAATTPPNPRTEPWMMTTQLGVALVSDDAHALHTDTWQSVGGVWTRLAGEQNLTPRIAAAMAYDPVRDEIVVHGGVRDLFSAFLRDDTWTFAGTWQLRQPTTSAPFSWNASMAFDRARGEAVLFGGGGMSGLLADTWAWNGQTWTQRTPATAPPARWHHRLSYDRARQRTVLFGGRDQNSELADTWEWDGTVWRQVVTTVAPPARQDHQQAYDVAAGRTVVFAGIDFAGPVADMWSFDGQRWTQLTPAHLPSTQLIGCEYDAHRGALVAMQANALWTWNGFDWQSSPLPTALVPPSESRSTLLFDEHRMRLVAFDEHPFNGGDRLYLETPTLAHSSDYGTDCAPAGTAAPRLFTIGRPALRDDTFGLGVRVAQPGQPVWIGLGLASQTLPLAGGCTLLVDQFLDIRLLPSGANGFADTTVPVPDVLYLRQLDVYAQALTISGAGTAVTRGLHLVVGD